MRRGRADAADESNPIMAVMSAALLRASAQVTIARSAQDRPTHGNGDKAVL
jgi:hypothetical protein